MIRNTLGTHVYCRKKYLQYVNDVVDLSLNKNIKPDEDAVEFAMKSTEFLVGISQIFDATFDYKNTYGIEDGMIESYEKVDKVLEVAEIKSNSFVSKKYMDDVRDIEDNQAKSILRGYLLNAINNTLNAPRKPITVVGAPDVQLDEMTLRGSAVDELKENLTAILNSKFLKLRTYGEKNLSN